MFTVIAESEIVFKGRTVARLEPRLPCTFLYDIIDIIESADAYAVLAKEHDETVKDIEAEHEKQIEELKETHASEISALNDIVDTLEAGIVPEASNEFTAFLRETLGTHKWVVATRMTDKKRKAGYELALHPARYKKLQELYQLLHKKQN